MPALDGKTAIVTGGATLIGAKIVEAFVADAAMVVLPNINDGADQRVAQGLGESVTFADTDITDDALDHLVRVTVDTYAGIDVLVDCAATYLDNQSVKLAEWAIRVNSVSPDWIWSNPIIGMTGDDRQLVDDVSKACSLRGHVGNREDGQRDDFPRFGHTFVHHRNGYRHGRWIHRRGPRADEPVVDPAPRAYGVPVRRLGETHCDERDE